MSQDEGRNRLRRGERQTIAGKYPDADPEMPPLKQRRPIEPIKRGDAYQMIDENLGGG